ncbi:MAG: hypothetical protein HN929_05295 [Chloroflexi bacterium]|jgi:hypothetical protein|nr:hypothetical protein [Chloroflexota bacterium]MBT7080868.1 hypothetical protein [Chloroflexota bacterium]MBT7290766.1 hypothetical protein [Chloroflexota bacterium]
MVRTDKVKDLLGQFFGPATAAQVDYWMKDGLSEDQIIAKSRAKVEGLLGKDKGGAFDSI